MKVTNKFNLPEAYLRAVETDEYTRGDAHVTASELGLPARLFALKRKHEAELEVDASELLPVLIGKAVHNILEKCDRESIVEERLYAECLGWTLGGKFDNHTEFNGVLTDWKTTRVDALQAKIKEGFKEWIVQMNVYRHLLLTAGRQVEKLRVIALLVDYSPLRKRYNSDYPPVPVMEIDIPVWPSEVTERYIAAKVATFQAALKDLPLCSDEERWVAGGETAVTKQGRKRAIKLFDTEEEAKEWMQTQDDLADLYIEKRPKQYLRCENYCPVREFCEQYKSEQLIIRKEP